MTAAERELRRQRRQLRGVENRAAAELRRTYLAVYKRLRENLDTLIEAIRQAESQGAEVKVSWLVNQWQYTQLIDELEREVWAWGRQSSETVAGAQHAALVNVNAHQSTLVGLSLPTQARIATELISLSSPAIQKYVGFAGDGKPLGELFDKIAPTVRKEAQDVISYGIARGQSPRVVASAFRKVASIPLDRALTISRTEMLRAYRSASLDWMQANNAVVSGWTWVCEFDNRTCIACAAMNGTFHPPTEQPGMHVNCRCTMSPTTKSWKELGFDEMEQFEPIRQTPEEMFDALPEGMQRSIMGNTRFDLYKSGQISLSDNVKVTHSPKWGDSHGVRPLKDLAA